MFGGYKINGANLTISKTFINIPTHFKIYLSLILYIIDNWKNEKI